MLCISGWKIMTKLLLKIVRVEYGGKNVFLLLPNIKKNIIYNHRNTAQEHNWPTSVVQQYNLRNVTINSFQTMFLQWLIIITPLMPVWPFTLLSYRSLVFWSTNIYTNWMILVNQAWVSSFLCMLRNEPNMNWSRIYIWMLEMWKNTVNRTERKAKCVSLWLHTVI